MEQKEIMSLLARVRMGDDEAFSLLASRFAGMTEGLVRSFSRGLCDLDGSELSQEAQVALYRAAHAYKESDDVTFGLFARVCVRNALISHLRRRKLPAGVSLCSLDPLLPLEEREPVAPLLEAEQLAILVAKMVGALSDYEQSVFALLVEGEETAFIADALGKSEKSVKNAVFRVQTKLRALLGN